jgi:hypothetical protein
MKLQYRAIEGTNTKTRRLAYLSAILLTLRQDSLSEQVLLSKLTKWSQDHRVDLGSYYVQTGEITSTRKNSAGARYLQLAERSGLIVPIAGMYRSSRMGLVVIALLMRHQLNDNPFYLNTAEKLFYTYYLLRVDADILLTVADSLLKNENGSLHQLQYAFRENFLSRLAEKGVLSRDEALSQQLRSRQIEIENEWKKPERYAEHIVPPRLNWLLDLQFLEGEPFRHHRFEFTKAGLQFLSRLPCFGNSGFCDVTEQWLDQDFWESSARHLMNSGDLVHWSDIDEDTRNNVMSRLLTEAFSAFRSTFVPTIPLSQAMLYLCIRLILEYQVMSSPLDLKTWLAKTPVLDRRRYEARLSPRENESYLLMKYEGE